jgi:hypothetical protein
MDNQVVPLYIEDEKLQRTIFITRLRVSLSGLFVLWGIEFYGQGYTLKICI